MEGVFVSGSSKITSSDNRFVKYLTKIFKMPKEMKSGTVELNVSIKDGGEVWNRTFIPK